MILRFNKRRDESDSKSTFTPSTSTNQPSTNVRSVNNDDNLIAIDTVRVDEQSRLTLTKRVKQVLPLEPGDKIAVYTDKGNPKTMLCKVQRRNEIVDTLTITKNVVVGATSSVDPLNNTRPDRKLFWNKNHNVQRPAKILLVDDEQDTIVTFKAALSSDFNARDHNVEAFTDALEAVKHFLEVENNNNIENDLGSYDLVVTDIRMPGLNGVQLYQILKAVDPTIKVYLCLV